MTQHSNALRTGVGAPSPVDIHVGTKVRARRVEIGMSQEKLGAAVGLTFQQIQKYERGANRIGASRLYEFSTILDVPIAYFYEGMPTDVVTAIQTRIQDNADLTDETAMDQETMKLVKTYYKVTSESVRRRIYELVKAVSQSNA